MFLAEILNDKEYLRRLIVIGLPLVLQQVITYSVNLLDTMMIGSFGDAPLAAVNLVNQFYLIFSLVIFGSISGGNVLNAQFWGKRDVRNIHHVMGIQFSLGFFVGFCFFAASLLAPHRILHIYSKDEAVIEAGITYLKVIAATFFLFPVGQIYSGALRCTGNTRIPMIISAVTLTINALLNYLLIFGKMGFPALGLIGAGLATVTARTIEALLYILITYGQHLPTAANIRDMFSFNRPLILLMLKKGAPVIINETCWAIGANMYTKIYAGISTPSIAAFSAVSPIDSIAQALFMGVGDASAVIIGNLLGAGELEKARCYAKYTIRLSLSAALLSGILLFFLKGSILSLYNLSAEASTLALDLLAVMAITLWLRTSNYTIIIGVLRPGGQAFYCLLAEGMIMWLIGIPIARLLAVNFSLPVYWAYFGNVAEEAIKLGVFYHRYRSGKWAVNLVNL